MEKLIIRALLGILATVIATGLQWVLWPWVQPSRFIVYYPIIILFSLIGGLTTGLFATLFSMVAAEYFFFPPLFTFGPYWGQDAPALAIFLISGVSVSLINERLRRRNQELVAVEIRKKADQLLRLVIDSAPIIIFLKDWDHRFIIANEASAKYFGTTVKQLEGHLESEIEFFMASEHGRSLQEEDREIMRTRQSRRSEVQVPGHDGTVHWFFAIKTPLIDLDGSCKKLLIISTDITERKQLEADRLNALQDAEAAVQVRDEFLSIASHELRTPLSALHLQLQLMERISKKEPIDSNILVAMSSKASISSQQLASLLDELLDVTRIRAGKLSLEKQDVDLKFAVIEGVSAMSELAKKTGNTVTIEADQPVVGHWDPVRINQIVSNLLSNAIKYGAGKPIEVTVMVDPKTKCARLLVRDHGIGISEEMQTKIFGRFERAVSGKKISGLGLGLYIVRQIVEAHHGSIRVESELGQGSTFIVELPLKLSGKN